MPALQVLDRYQALLGKLSESERGKLQRSMGMKMEQLKARCKPPDRRKHAASRVARCAVGIADDAGQCNHHGANLILVEMGIRDAAMVNCMLAPFSGAVSLL